MGGQACVFYGAAEFSRDCDVAVLCDEQNLDRSRTAFNELGAEVIAVPTLRSGISRSAVTPYIFAAGLMQSPACEST